MPGPQPMRLVRAALRCYPPRWRSRHGEEAAELARLLLQDGTPARLIAWSYVKGAVSARLVPQPRRRLGAAVGALIAAACSLGVPLALLSPSVPASAASAARPREAYAAAADIFRPGGMLHCSPVLGESVRQALPALQSLQVKITWVTSSGTSGHRPRPDGHYYVVGGMARSAVSISLRVTANKPARSNAPGSHGSHC